MQAPELLSKYSDLEGLKDIHVKSVPHNTLTLTNILKLLIIETLGWGLGAGACCRVA